MSKINHWKIDSLKLITLASCLVLVGLFPACASKQVQVLTSPELNNSARSTLNQLAQAQNQLNALSGFAQVRIRARGKTEEFEAAFLMRFPDKLRIEILDDLGRTRYRLIADGHQVFWEESGSGEYSLAAQDRDSLKKAFRLPLAVEEFVARLMLKLPPIPAAPLNIVRENGSQEYQIELDREEVTLELQPPKLKALTAYKTTKKRKKRYRVRYEGLEFQEDYTLARAVQWEFAKPRAQVEIEFLNIQGNPSLPLAKFRLPNPGGNF